MKLLESLKNYLGKEKIQDLSTLKIFSQCFNVFVYPCITCHLVL